MRDTIRELRRRKVFTVGAAYVVIAWLLLQVAATVFPIFDAPPWVLKVFIALLALGLPLAVVLAWAYELTPAGVVRTTPGPSGEPETAESATAVASDQTAGGVELPTGPSIAVLPLRNLSAEGTHDLFAESLTHDIVTGLTRSSHLFVLAGDATETLQKNEQDPARAGQRLGVSYLLSGTVQKAGERLRVGAELTDVAAARRIWSQQYDRELNAENLFDVQDDIRERIVATLSDLHGVIYSTQSKRNVHRPTNSLNAYECLSVALAYDKNITPEYHLRARQSLERAIEIDPNFDEAWSHLSWIYTDEAVYGFNPLPDSMERALRAARKAVELDPDNYHTHWLLSRVHYFMGNRDLFFVEVEKSLDLNSSDGTTLGLLGVYTALAGDWARGMDMLDKARKLNPHHPDYYYTCFGMAAFVRGEYEQALTELQKASLPEWPPHQLFLAATYAMLDRAQETRRVLDDLRRVRPAFTPEEARSMLNRIMPFQPELVETVVACLVRIQ